MRGFPFIERGQNIISLWVVPKGDFGLHLICSESNGKFRLTIVLNCWSEVNKQILIITDTPWIISTSIVSYNATVFTVFTVFIQRNRYACILSAPLCCFALFNKRYYYLLLCMCPVARVKEVRISLLSIQWKSIWVQISLLCDKNNTRGICQGTV